MKEMTSHQATELLRQPETDQALVLEQWATWLYQKHGGKLSNTVLDAVWAYAWREGHSDGLLAVEFQFADLVGLAEKIVAAELEDRT